MSTLIRKGIDKLSKKSFRDSESVIFVFYNLLKEYKWLYNDLPKYWHWVGSGFAAALTKKRSKFLREEQFSGPLSTRKETMNYLKAYFNRMKDKGIVESFKIEVSYKP